MKAVTSADPRGVFDRVPFMALLGVRREHSEGGRARLALDPRPELGNVIGAVHGGVLVTLLDVAMASAAVSRVDFALTVVTLDLDTRFLEPGRGALLAHAEVVGADEPLVWCRAEVRDVADRLIAQGLGSFRYLARPSE